MLTRCFVLAVLTGTAAAQCPVQKVTSPAPFDQAFLGSDLAFDGEWLFAASTVADGASPGSGVVEVYRRAPDVWTRVDVLSASDGQTGDLFGATLSLDGDRLAIHAVGAQAVYVFELFQGQWVEASKAVAFDPTDDYGSAMALSGDWLAVGMEEDGALGASAGAVRTFQRLGNFWEPRQKLVASDGKAGDLFGASLALEGGRLVIGASSAEGAVAGSGAAYVFELGDQWTETAKLIGSDAGAGDRFGFFSCTALSGDVALIGAPYSGEACGSGASCDSGSAYLFRKQGAAWVQEQKFAPTDLGDDARFGTAPHLNQGRAFIGASAGGELLAGTVRGYVEEPGGWVQAWEFTPPDPGFADGFTRPVAAGDDVAIGSRRDDEVQVNSGAVYLFSLDPQHCPSLFAGPNALSLSKGGSQFFLLDGGADGAGDAFVLLGSLSGTAPGTPVGGQVLPLVVDAYLDLTLTSGSPMLGSPGVLDAKGRAEAELRVPPNTAAPLLGLSAHHAFLTLDTSGGALDVVLVSNPVPLTLVP